jgi:hypothetical protein
MWTALLATMVFGATPNQDAAPKGDKEDPKIIARGVWPVRADKPQQVVVRSAQELALALGVDAKHARDRRFQNDAVSDTIKLLKVKEIDWNKQMLVVVTAGAQRTGGYRVDIESLRVKDGVLIVNWKLHVPQPGVVVTQAISYPAQMALVDHFHGSVQFDPPAEKK